MSGVYPKVSLWGFKDVTNEQPIFKVIYLRNKYKTEPSTFLILQPVADGFLGMCDPDISSLFTWIDKSLRLVGAFCFTRGDRSHWACS